MKEFGNSASSSIEYYLHQHRLLQESTGLLSRAPMWEPRTFEVPIGGHAAGHPFMLTALPDVADAQGRPCSLIVGQAEGDTDSYYAWLRPKDQLTEFSEPTKLHKRSDGLYELNCNGMKMVGDKFLYNHQSRAVADYAAALAQHAEEDANTTSREVVAFATGTGKSYIVGHAIKAMGQEGVVVVPEDLGKQILKELKEVMPETDIRAGSDFPTARPPKDFKGIVVLEEGQELDRFMGYESHPGWLCSGAPKFIAIDEAHELTMRFKPDAPAPGRYKLERLAKHNHIMAVTATPNEELFEAMGIAHRAPASVMTMYDATHRLRDRAFRPLSLEMRQVGAPRSVHDLSAQERERINLENEPAMRFEALAGYFGRDEYAGPDYYINPSMDAWEQRTDSAGRFEPASKHFSKAKINNDTIDSSMAGLVSVSPKSGSDAEQKGTAIIRSMKANLVRSCAHKHIAFSVRPSLMKNLAQDLQDIHDRQYADMEALRKEVWLRRAQSSIAEYIREYRREFGLTNTLEAFLSTHELGILAIRGENLAKSVKNQADYRAAIRSIVPDDFRSVLPGALFDELIKSETDIDLSAEARSAAATSMRSAALQQVAVAELHISKQQARSLALSGKIEAELAAHSIDFSNLDTDQPQYYALALVHERGKEVIYNGHTRTTLTADDLMQLVGEGKVMHVADTTHKFVTGFSDKDVMATTRIIENLGDYTVRATQILGRPIRDKNGIASLHEIVGPCVNLAGKLGIDRHFSCYDVISENFLERSRQYERNFVHQGRELWAPSTAHTATVTAGAPGVAHDHGAGR